uniref:Uncharacterized protein n=1 Tax=Colobus angolensis palliatus TaxID=336983 RepID=A0A2K5JWZ4_COLAP
MQAWGVGLLWLEARREGWVVGGGDKREAWSGTRSSSAFGGGGGQIAFFLEPWAPHGLLECSELLSPSGPLCRREVSRAGPVPLAHPRRGCTLDQSPNLSVATVLSGKVSLQHSCPLEPQNVTLFGNWVVADGIS